MFKLKFFAAASLVFTSLLAMEEMDHDPSNSESKWYSLPSEMKAKVLEELNDKDKLNARLVSKEFNEHIITSNLFWFEKFQDELSNYKSFAVQDKNKSWNEKFLFFKDYDQNLRNWISKNFIEYEISKKSFMRHVTIDRHIDSTYLPDNFIEYLPENLTSLTFLRNDVKALPESLKDLSDLLSLNLIYTKMEHLPLWLIKMPNLKLIRIDNSPINTSSILAILFLAPHGFQCILSSKQLEEIKSREIYSRIKDKYVENLFDHSHTKNLILLKKNNI